MKQASSVTAMVEAGFPAWVCVKWLQYMIDLGYEQPLTDSFDYPCYLAEDITDVNFLFESHGEDNCEALHVPGDSDHAEYWANMSDDGGPLFYCLFDHITHGS